MSTSITTTQVKTITPKVVTTLKNDHKPFPLIRSSSIEKIRQFNTYICSQHYYMLPAILNWVKSSQNSLNHATEKTILLFRALLFKSYLYKFFILGLQALKPKCNLMTLKKDVNVAIKTVIWNFYDTFSHTFESTFVLKVGVYLGVASVSAQMFYCLYILYFINLTPGFVFLLACTVYIKVLYFQTMCLKKKSSKKHK